MKRLLLFAMIAAGNWARAAQATIEPTLPPVDALLLSQGEAQRIFDDVVARADRVEIQYTVFHHSKKEADARVWLGDMTDRSEINSLSSAVRIQLPPVIKVTMHGEERLGREMMKIDAPGCFILEFSRQGKKLSQLRIYGDEVVGFDAVLPESVLKVHRIAMAPLLSRLNALLLDKWPGPTCGK